MKSRLRTAGWSSPKQPLAGIHISLQKTTHCIWWLLACRSARTRGTTIFRPS
jgi:hypothetical protein